MVVDLYGMRLLCDKLPVEANAIWRHAVCMDTEQQFLRCYQVSVEASQKSAIRNSVVYKWRSVERSRCLPIIVESIGRDVVGIVPRAGRNAVPPGVAIRNLKSSDFTGNLNSSIGCDSYSLITTGVKVVRPRISITTNRFRVCRRAGRRRGRRMCGWFGRAG